MNTKLNEFVKKITIGHYTLSMKDGSIKYVKRSSEITDLDTGIKYTRTSFQEAFGDDIVSIQYGIVSDDFERWKHVYTDDCAGKFVIDGDQFQFEIKQYYTGDEATYVNVFLYHQIPWNGVVLCDTFESLKDSVSHVEVQC
ncbi:hypothetical protein 65p200 [Aeromonas phage 65]|uniref:Uncharacterized protein n=2 Tax=Ishigurovirus osborne TaxID=260149 RepID=A0A219YCA5_9CAUD|nr:hypothetical protein ST65p200 [Aeromonas phage 65]ADQ53208.1 hypothetical protein 65p200 [Aeromonas phage 65]APU01585.1 hypothetical protein [Aeromonas phage 65.2]